VFVGFFAPKGITVRFLAGPRSLPFSHRRSRPRSLRLAATDKRTYREPKASIRRDITVTDRLVRIDVRLERPPYPPSRGLIWFPRSRRIREEPLAASSNAIGHPRRGWPDITRCTSGPRLSPEGEIGLALLAWQGRFFLAFPHALCSAPRVRIYTVYAFSRRMNRGIVLARSERNCS